jgi:oligosaccharide repeat unit polymerase
MWTLFAMVELGPIKFLVTIYQRWHYAGDFWIKQKPFTGARLVYTGLIGVSVFAASTVGYWKSRTDEHLDIPIPNVILFTISILPLFFLPLLVGQLILFFTALLASLVAYALSRNRNISLWWIILAATLGFFLWTAQELIRVGFAPKELIVALKYSLDRFLLYFANDVGNLNRGVHYLTHHSYGFFSFNFIFRFLFVEEAAKEMLLTSQYKEEADVAMSAGTWTALGTPYADFGPFGSILIFTWGFLSQKVFKNARNNLFSCQLYGMITASILLSWHSALWSNPLFWFNILILFLLNIPDLNKSNNTEAG